MRVAQVGNFEPSHSTENELRRALRYGLGLDVDTVQENNLGGWERLTSTVAEYDFILWTRTASLAPPHATQWALIETAAEAGVPTVAYHLDRWWGLRRENEVRREPFFRCALVCTADGGHDEQWAEVGVEHHWYPPAVSQWECMPGRVRPEYEADVVFVGGWDGYGHSEAWHRPALVQFLRDRYRDRVRFHPAAGQPAVRGRALRDLYTSARVVVGDSCILSTDEGRYWSDRVPETTGRGGYLVHVDTPGLADEHPSVARWPMGDWDALAAEIDRALEDPADVYAARRLRMTLETCSRHTYTRRMDRLVAEVAALP